MLFYGKAQLEAIKKDAISKVFGDNLSNIPSGDYSAIDPANPTCCNHAIELPLVHELWRAQCIPRRADERS
jgi:hypothetical protein